MGGPDLRVDTDALNAVARELAELSAQLDGSLIHEWQPPVDQPTGQATVDLTAAANHVMTESSANLLLFADNIAKAARTYDETDSGEADKVIATMDPPK